MNFSPRLRQILLILIDEKGIVSIKRLADEIKVSKRTVQRELEYIDSSLKKYKITLRTKTGAGIWLDGTSEHKDLLKNELQGQDVMDSGNKKNRRNQLILEILKDRSLQKLYYYANIFQVSEATISHDMEVISSWFEQRNLTLVKKQGYGVSLEGSEKDYRLAVRKFINDNIDNQFFQNIFQEKKITPSDVMGSNEDYNIYRLLNNEILQQVLTCLISIQDKRISRLTDNSYIGLVLHVTIAIDRILKKESIEPNEEFEKNFRDDEDYELAKHIINSLEEQFQIVIPDVEIAYICLHIKGSKLKYIDEKEQNTEDSVKREELLEIAERMIKIYDETIALELKQDEEFIAGLVAHLHPTFIRLKNHMLISNPLLDQIIETYPEIYYKCEKIGFLLEERFSCKIPRDEIGYLAMHFGAAVVRLESQKESKRKVDIGIVCASGIGISRLMLSKLKRFLKERANLTAYGKEEITAMILKETDFFVSSIEMDKMEADVVLVNPLLVESDLEQIDGKVKIYAGIPKRRAEEVQAFSQQLDQVSIVAAQIKYIIKSFDCIWVNNSISFAEVLEAMTEKVSPYREKQLLIQEDIIRREKIATQVIPEYGFALFHTRTAGVVRPSITICLTKDLTPFKDPYFVQVKVVIMMLMPKSEYTHENSEILGYISSSFVENENFLDVIRKGNLEEMKGYLTNLLKNYFNQYLDNF